MSIMIRNGKYMTVTVKYFPHVPASDDEESGKFSSGNPSALKIVKEWKDGNGHCATVQGNVDCGWTWLSFTSQYQHGKVNFEHTTEEHLPTATINHGPEGVTETPDMEDAKPEGEEVTGEESDDEDDGDDE